MSRSRTHLNFVPRGRQRGIATILIVLLVGMALTATAIGVVHAIRSTQQRQLSVHSSTPAQATAWRGVEVIRTYLSSSAITASVLDTWAAGSLPRTLTVTNVPGFTSAQVTAVTPNTPTTGTYRISVNFTGSAASGGAGARSLMEAVYLVVPGASGGSTPPPLNGNVINRDLTFTGSANVSNGTVFNVGGDVTINSNVTFYNESGSATQDITINSTGSVNLSGGGQNDFDLITANGDVTIGGTSYADVVETLGNITFNDSGTAGTVTAGGTETDGTETIGKVMFKGGSLSVNTAEVANATGNIEVDSGKQINAGTLNSKADVSWPSGGSTNLGAVAINADGKVTYAGGANKNSTKPTITAAGMVDLKQDAQANAIKTPQNISIKKNSAKINMVDGGGTLTIEDVRNGIASASSPGIIAGAIVPVGTQNDMSNIYVSALQTGHTVTVSPVSFTPAAEVVLSEPVVDVYALESQANYAFTVVSGYMKVHIKNVNGIADGDYFIGRYVEDSSKWDYLCTAISTATAIEGSGTCTAPAYSSSGSGMQRFCVRTNNNNSSQHCLFYKDVNGSPSFVINDNQQQTMPTGFYWFDGNLKLWGYYDPPYHATFMATGNILTDGNSCYMAPNFSGLADMASDSCNGTPTIDPYTAVCTNVANNMYPKQLCTTAYVPNDIGNMAFLAGGCDGSGGCAAGNPFTGGLITLNAGTTVYGSIMGDDLITANTTKIEGYLGITGQDTSNSTNVAIEGSATVVMPTEVSGVYDPGQPPCMIPGGCGGGTPTASVLWTRYR